MLISIFYARFHTERGPVILRQYPQQTVFALQRSNEHEARLISFGEVSQYIIPPYELCNKPLSITVRKHVILGLPVSIENSKYPRNRFTFNVCFVLSEGLDAASRRAWDAVVKKTATWFKLIEVESAMLSNMNEDNELASPNPSPTPDVVSKVLKGVYKQLSSYGECCVSVSPTYVLNLRLCVRQEYVHKTAQPWEVPLIIANLPDQEYHTWNLALQQIHKHIDGVNHIRRIADLASVELDLVQKTIEDLVESGTATLLDIFHFQAMYALTEDFTYFVGDKDMLVECLQYVVVEGSQQKLSSENLVDLYLALRPGISIAEFGKDHQRQLKTIDARRLITFGVIKGFLRRVHRYARLIEAAPPPDPATKTASRQRAQYEDAVTKFEKAWKQAALSSGWSTPPADLPASVKMKAHRTVDEVRRAEDEKLRQYLDGQHCFDEICVEMGLSEKAVLERLSSHAFGEIYFVTK